MRLQDCGQPFVIGMDPCEANVSVGETDDRQSIWAWVHELLPVPVTGTPCIVSDRFLLDAAHPE